MLEVQGLDTLFLSHPLAAELCAMEAKTHIINVRLFSLSQGLCVQAQKVALVFLSIEFYAQRHSRVLVGCARISNKDWLPAVCP